MAVLTYSETIPITLPAAYSRPQGLAVVDNVLNLLVTGNSRANILGYPITGGDTPDTEQALQNPVPEARANSLDNVGDSFAVPARQALFLVNSLGAIVRNTTNFFVHSHLAVTYDADDMRLLFLVRDTLSGSSNYLRVAVYTVELGFTSYINIGEQSNRQDNGLVEYSSDRVWLMYGRAGRELQTYTSQFVALDEPQPLIEIPDAVEIRDISFWANNLYVLTSDASVYVYAGEQVVSDVGEPVRQLFMDSPYFQKYAVVRQANPLNVLTFNADMIAVTSTDLFRFLIGGVVTLEDVLDNVAIVPQFTIPAIEVDDKVFLYDGEEAPTTIPDDALTVSGIQRVGQMQRQILYTKEPTVTA